jgi:hypothetical protein
MVWTTMTTVGYGDLYPISFGGRIMVVLASMFGISIASILVSVFTSTLQFKVSQRNAFHDLMELKRHERLYESAGALIYYSWRYAMHKKKLAREESRLREKKLASKKQRMTSINKVAMQAPGRILTGASASTRVITSRMEKGLQDKRFYTQFERSRQEFNAARRADAKKHDTQAIETIIKAQFMIQEKMRKMMMHNTAQEAKINTVAKDVAGIHSKLDRLLQALGTAGQHKTGG